MTTIHILLVAETEIEKKALENQLEKQTHAKIDDLPITNGKLGIYEVAIFQLSDPSDSSKKDHDNESLKKIVTSLQTKAVFFVVPVQALTKDVPVGDIIVSSQLSGFTSSDKNKIIRDDNCLPSGVHLNPRFDVMDLLGWNFTIEKRNIQLHRSLLISGSNEINLESIDQSFQKRANSGLISEGYMKKITSVYPAEWIVIGANSGNNNQIKDQCAAASVSAIKHILSNPCLGGLGCKSLK